MDYKLPPEIVIDLSNTFYHKYVEPFEKSGDLLSLKQNWEKKKLSSYKKAFSRRYNIKTYNVVIIFIIFEINNENVNYKYIANLLKQITDYKNLLLDRIAEEIEQHLNQNNNTTFTISDGDNALFNYEYGF